MAKPLFTTVLARPHALPPSPPYNYVQAILTRSWNGLPYTNVPTDDRSLLYQNVTATGRGEIRLLEIKPGNEHDDMRGTLFTASLAVPPTYEAISYTWATPEGDVSLSESIICQWHGRELRIPFTVNCRAALRHIRRADQPRLIWIDTICINQEDVEERNIQVALMSEIYSLASGVVFFLGESSNDSDMILDFLQACAEDSFAIQNRAITIKLRAALPSLLSRAWFHRVWVLQEIALAQRATVICGTRSIPYECLTSKNLEFLGFNPRIFNGSIPPVLKLSGAGTLPFDFFQSLLHIARPCHSTDSRDKIFALFGMLNITWRQDMRADYTTPVQRVYTEIAVYFIRRYNTLDILSFVEHPSNVEGLPWWVPDWSKPLRLPPFDPPRALPRMNRHVPDVADLPPPDTVWDLARMAVRGRVIDVVRIVSAVDLPTLVQAIALTRQLGSQSGMASFWELLELQHFARLEFPWALNVAVDAAGWEPLELVEYPFGTHIHGIGSLYRDLSSNAHFCTRELQGLLHEAEVVGRGRSFIFGAAAVGIGPPQTQADDLIVLLEGSQRPVVLRRRHLGLVLVGECYFPPAAQTKKRRHECCWHVVDGRRKCHKCELLDYQERIPVQGLMLM